MLSPRPLRPSSCDPARTIVSLLHERTGQQLDESRAWRIDSALQPLLREHGFAGLDGLAAALATGSDRLADTVVDALLNQETSFYRDTGVLDLAADVLSAQRQAEPTRRPRAWSAGCSVGQEPYSLAMLMAERTKVGDSAPDIVATDVSPAAISRARAGRYSQFEIQRGLPVRRMLQWFDQDGEKWIARADLVRLVSFRRHNLVSEAPPFGLFDLILCRNVLLYFAGDVRRTVFDRLADALRPGGTLILGAGETTIGQTDRFRPSQRFRGAYDLAV